MAHFLVYGCGNGGEVSLFSVLPIPSDILFHPRLIEKSVTAPQIIGAFGARIDVSASVRRNIGLNLRGNVRRGKAPGKSPAAGTDGEGIHLRDLAKDGIPGTTLAGDIVEGHFRKVLPRQGLRLARES